MADKNILIKKYNGNDWDNIYPVTKAKNVTLTTGGNVEDNLANKASLDVNGKVPLSQLPAIMNLFIVKDATERNALTGIVKGNMAFETDTGKTYIYDGTKWIIQADADWANVNLQWSNIVGKPNSAVASIDSAVTNSHTHSNKAILDATTASYTTALDTKLAGIAAGANVVASSGTNGNVKINGTETVVYTHPTGDGNLHVPANGTTNSGKFLKAFATAGNISWAAITQGDVANFATQRINLNGQLQTVSYRRSVIALCEVTNTNPSFNSYSVGTFSIHRPNGLSGAIQLQVAAEKLYNKETLNISFLRLGQYTNQPTTIKACTFTYNGVKYGGLEIWITEAEHSNIEFNGATNFGIFGLDYYNTQTSTAINTEIANSIEYTSPVVADNLTLNSKKVWHEANMGAGSKMDTDLLDGKEGAFYQDASNLNAGIIAAARLPLVTTSANGAMIASDKTKLDGITAGANVVSYVSNGVLSFNGSNTTIYAHPTGDGNLHVPANGTGNANKVLKASATAGTYTWGNVAFNEISALPSTLEGHGITNGTLTGSLTLSNASLLNIKKSDDTPISVAKMNGSRLQLGDATMPIMIASPASPIYYDGTGQYSFWTAKNFNPNAPVIKDGELVFTRTDWSEAKIRVVNGDLRFEMDGSINFDVGGDCFVNGSDVVTEAMMLNYGQGKFVQGSNRLFIGNTFTGAFAMDNDIWIDTSS